MRLKFVVLSVIFLIFCNGCSITKINLQEGIKSFQEQNYRQAFIRLTPEAEKGNPDAQYAVGYMYYYGQGVTEDKQKALYWINCAAKKGQPDAIEALRILQNPPPITK